MTSIEIIISIDLPVAPDILMRCESSGASMPSRIATPRLSAGAVVVRQTPEGWCFLLLRAFRSWDFPKGMVEAGEDPHTAARREVREESAIDDLEFTWGDVFRDTGPYTRNKVARYFIAQTRTADVRLPVNPLLGVPEHHEWRWVDFDEAFTLVSPRVAPVVEWAYGVINGEPFTDERALGANADALPSPR